MKSRQQEDQERRRELRHQADMEAAARLLLRDYKRFSTDPGVVWMRMPGKDGEDDGAVVVTRNAEMMQALRETADRVNRAAGRMPLLPDIGDKSITEKGGVEGLAEVRTALHKDAVRHHNVVQAARPRVAVHDEGCPTGAGGACTCPPDDCECIGLGCDHAGTKKSWAYKPPRGGTP